jgi:S1-C subfamily serine protease
VQVLTSRALKEDSLRETAPVVTFGFPFGRNPTVGRETYLDMTVLSSKITALRRDHGRLEGVQFDGQLNPGNSGGPVVDESGGKRGCRDGRRHGR